MPTENQAFWDQFKQMFEDPFQRRQLVEYFDKLVEDCTKNPKPMRVAFIGNVRVFIYFMKKLKPNKAGQYEVEIGNLTIVLCSKDRDVYGREFDAFVVYGPDTTNDHYDAAFYLSGCNVPKLDTQSFHMLIEEHKNAMQHA